MVLLHEYLAFTIKRIFRLGQTFLCLLGLLVCMSGHVFWLRVFFQFYSMFFFSLIQYKINVVVVVVVCRFRAREPPLLLLNTQSRLCFSPTLFPGASRFSKWRGCASCLAQLLAIHTCSPLLLQKRNGSKIGQATTVSFGHRVSQMRTI